MITSQRGQAALESVLAAPLVAIVLGVGFYLMYLCFAQQWMNRSVREAAACLVTRASVHQCRSRLQATLKVGLPFGNAEIDVFQRGRTGARVQVSFDAYTRFISDSRLPQQLVATGFFPSEL